MDAHRFALLSRKFALLRDELAEAGIDCSLSFSTPPGARDPVAYLVGAASAGDMTAARREIGRAGSQDAFRESNAGGAGR